MYSKVTIGNGIRVVMEQIPHFRSVSLGMWFDVGSIHETSNQTGMAHFIEHMLFKGTENRSAKQIAEVMDAVGGQINAFTAKECTCYYCKVMDEHLHIGIELLADMVLNSVFDAGELEKEKGVILEEINMYDDSPEDLVHDLLSEAFFGEHPLARPILGHPNLVAGYGREEILEFFKQYYQPGNLVISAAGNFDEALFLEEIERCLGNWQGKGKSGPELQPVRSQTGVLYRHKDIEQVHLCLGTPGIPMGQDEVYPLLLLNNIFGGGMSSRLFQRIREDKGLTYSVFSYPSNYTCGGLFSIYAGMKPSQAPEVLTLIMDEIDLMRSKGISREEFHIGREQLKGNYILGMESTGSRMTAIGKAELLLNKVITPEEVLQKIADIRYEQIPAIIDKILPPGSYAAATVGPEDLSSVIKGSLEGR